MADESTFYLGLHAGHDANVCVMDNQGIVLFAAGEERFNRKKMYAGFPEQALGYALTTFGKRFECLATPRMDTLSKVLREIGFLWHSMRNGLAAPRFGIWFTKGLSKLFQGRSLERGTENFLPVLENSLVNVEHHHAHAASAFYPSGFQKAYVMTLDGEGDGFSCCIYQAEGNQLNRLAKFYHNDVTIGRDYEKVTAMLGFHPLRHPGKITGLAAFGQFNQECIETLLTYLKKSWHIDRHRVLSSKNAYQIISNEGKKSLIRDRDEIFKSFSDQDIAYAIQYITEHKVIDIIRRWIPNTHKANIVLAGGVFANVALNKKIKELGFNNIFVQPAMTDAGLSLGSILYHMAAYNAIVPFNHVFFGPSYSTDEIKSTLEAKGIDYKSPKNPEKETARLLAQGKVVARFDGRMEFGPRALGNRSILYQASDVTVNDWLNKKLQRTEFMPFAPVTLERFAEQCYRGYRGAERAAKYMTITFDCTEQMSTECPAVVHVDGTARPQIINKEDNPGYNQILEEYFTLTGIPTLINTSFNMHEEPIVMTPEDAIRAFQASQLDALLIGPYIIINKQATQNI
ncbi:hypothetical protein JW979_14080 [bacterium]|nr:hypothetical protein [candidate division CSSED10-310 bacterium]